MQQVLQVVLEQHAWSMLLKNVRKIHITQERWHRKHSDVHACCSIPIGIVATFAILTLIPLVTSPFTKRFCTTGLAICENMQYSHYGFCLL